MILKVNILLQVNLVRIQGVFSLIMKMNTVGLIRLVRKLQVTKVVKAWDGDTMLSSTSALTGAISIVLGDSLFFIDQFISPGGFN